MAGHTPTGRAAAKGGQTGFTLLGVLFMVAGLGVGMAALGTLWHTASQREREVELLFVGNQYRQAIERFWNKSPGVKRLPKNIDELLTDPRFPNTVRHLRRLYRDPMTGGSEWGLVEEPTGGISGVYSLSEDRPFKLAGFAASDAAFGNAASYRDWVFRFDFEKAENDARKAAAATRPASKAGGQAGPAAK